MGAGTTDARYIWNVTHTEYDSKTGKVVRENISEDEAKQLHTNYLGFLLDRQKSRLILKVMHIAEKLDPKELGSEEGVKSLSLTDPVFRLRKQRQELRIGHRHHQKPLPANAHGTVVDPEHPPYLLLLHPAIAVEHLHQQPAPGTPVALS